MNFPYARTLCSWGGPGRALGDFTGYFPAKKHRDVGAALEICEALYDEQALDDLYEFGENANLGTPIVVAPALLPEESQNVLARTYAKWVANQLHWESGDGIYQLKTMNRDFISDGWFRIAHEPEFYGSVETGRAYLIADDVMTMGGTVASLRGFIESQGGTVFAITALASRNGGHAQISLAENTLSQLKSALDGELALAVSGELGYGVECLTEPEGRFLLRNCPSVDTFRTGISRARYP